VNLIDALERLKEPVEHNARPLRVYLACGCTPLHLQTFLAAQLRTLYPARRVELNSGLFGDLAGNLERLRPEEQDALAVVIEWPDLDARLGARSLGGWQVQKLPDIVNTVNHSFERLADALRGLPPTLPISICLPTLPFPPLFYTSTQQSSTFELKIRRSLASFAETISISRQVSVINAQRVDEISPLANRFNLRTEVTQGFPYTTFHASVMGELLAELVHCREPLKGLITDLDDTLWTGILGEEGVQAIGWHLEQHAHLHGLYQQLLESFASAGILIAVASKNDAALVEQAFEREDLLLSRTNIFPIEAHWRQKSESVHRILEIWNVLADSVVFVDDSPMEVAEVKRAFPKMECLVFPKNDYPALWEMLGKLRNCFAKTAIAEEDALRLESIRNSTAFVDVEGGERGSLEDFLQQAEGRLTFVLDKSVGDPRALELLNKTNQFNLNGKRYDQAAWLAFLKDSGTCLLIVSYEDKFGKLGRIAVLIGRPEGKTFLVEGWAMSCRAFSRRIEYHCLQYLFEKFAVDEIVFEVQATSRNAPLMEFIEQLLDGRVDQNPHLSRSSFLRNAPKMPHRVEEVSTIEQH
jgi:FkbH-like protein